MPDHPEKPCGDHRHVEDQGRTHLLARRAGIDQGAADLSCDQRQQDEAVHPDQQAARRRVADRGDAALRRARPQPGAEDHVVDPPVEQPAEDLLAELAAEALGIADLGLHEAGNDRERDQRHEVEQDGEREGAQRRMSDQPVDAARPGPPQHGPGNDFRQQPAHDYAQQQQRGATVDDVGEVQEMPAERRDLAHGEVQPLGHDVEEGTGGGLPRIDRLGQGRTRPGGGEAAQTQGNAEP